jgi:hypothetical protein
MMKNFLLIILLAFSIACGGSTASTKKGTTVSANTNFFSEKVEKKVYKEKDLEMVVVEDAPARNPEGEKQTWLYLDEVAPYNGILLNPDGIAYILSEYEALKLRSGAALEKQRQSDLAKLNLEIGQLVLELETAEKKGNIVIRGRDEEIKRLQKINQDIREDKSDIWNDVFLAAGSGVAGILVGLLIYFVAQ